MLITEESERNVFMTAKEWVEINWPKIEARAKIPVRAQVITAPYGTVQTCRYRVDHNGKNIAPENCCFIGIVIHPDDYKADMEGTGTSDLFPKHFDIKLSPREEDRLARLQRIHDKYDIENWPQLVKSWKEQWDSQFI